MLERKARYAGNTASDHIEAPNRHGAIADAFTSENIRTQEGVRHGAIATRHLFSPHTKHEKKVKRLIRSPQSSTAVSTWSDQPSHRDKLKERKSNKHITSTVNAAALLRP